MPFISQDFIKDLQNKVDIIQTINKRVKLAQKGNHYKACCPFHQEKTPSFTVSPSKQGYYCFGCGEGGYVIDFLMKHDNLNYVDAVQQLADENGIEVIYESSNNNAVYKKKSSDYDAFIKLSTEVANIYKSALKNSKEVINYAKSREINGEIAKRFGLGYAPNNWQTLTNTHSREDIAKLISLGLIKHNETQQKYYDLFVDRLIFPIYNNKSQVIAFGGRTLSKDGQPKYLNSPASEIFDKSATLYGLDIARKYSKKLDYLLIVEGYMDVVSLHSKGVTKVVATLGTATTTKHIELLKRSTGHIIFCFDGDDAGKKAAIKALTIVLPYLSASMEVSFLFMPEDLDPDDVIKDEGLIAFNKRIEHATKLSKFLFEVCKDSDFDTIEGKVRFTKKSYEMINLIQYPAYKTQLLGALATTVDKDVSIIEQDFAHTHNKNTVTTSNSEPTNSKVNLLQTTKDKVLKNYLAAITQIILNYPECANEELLSNIKSIKETGVTSEIITTAMLLTNPHVLDLIHIFKSNKQLYNRLIYLSKQCPKFTPDEAKKELSTALTALQKYIEGLGIDSEITNVENLTPKERQALIKKISKRKAGLS